MTDKMAASHRHVTLVQKTIQGSISLNKTPIQEVINNIDKKGESVSIITVIGSDEENLCKLFTQWLLTFADAKLNGVSVSSFDLPRRDSFDTRLKAAYPKDYVVCFETYLPNKQSKCLVLYAPSVEVFQIFAVLASSVIVTFEKSQKEKIQQLMKCLDLTSTNIAFFDYIADVRPGSVDELKMGQKFQQYIANLQIPECVDSTGKKIPLANIALHFERVVNIVNGAFEKRDVNSTRDKDELCLSLESGCTPSTSPNVEAEKTHEDIPKVYKTEGYAFSKYAQPGCKIPVECVPLQIRCPAFICASQFATYQWVCADTDCSEPLQYDFNDYVYCKCGRSKIMDLRYKCAMQHDSSFQKPDPELLTSALKDLKPPRPLNILILGETGVGKSTWINGFVNFLSYETLDIAEKGELQSLVPTKFTVYNEDFEEILVSTGDDKNEVYNAGESATQTAKIYPFKVGESLIRIIDTPGIGDTRGPTQDQQNFENILGTLSGIEELHGICILLKPNNSRLNVMFRFCVKELLTYLHRDASKNILFCFTNSRGTFYRPGDTMPALLKLLKEYKDVSIPVNKQNIFCYDSESFRFLAAIKNKPPVSFTDEERANFANSWTKSIQETGRMLEYIQTLPPHYINNTLNLNNTRQLVLKLARPLAEINRNIRTNKKIQEDQRNDIQKTKETLEELQKKRLTKRTTIKVHKLYHPKTVCSNSSCVKVWTLADNITTNEYITACHNPCTLTGTPADSIGHTSLMGCEAMSNNFCRHCKHSYREHLHVYYDSLQQLETVVDTSVDEAIKSSKNAQELKEKMILNITLLLSECDNEIKMIEESCAYFAHFLKTNAITPYNDAVEQYLDHFINEEKAKVKCGGNKKALKELEASKRSYLEQKRILDESMRTGDGLNRSIPMSQEDIWKRVEDLRQLKHSGRNLTEALECVTHSQYNSFSTVAYDNTVYTRTWSDGGIGRVFKTVMSKTLGFWTDRRVTFYK